MITVTAVGTVTAVQSSKKALMMSLVSRRYDKEQYIGVTIFLNQRSKIQNTIKKGMTIAVTGQLDVNKFNGKTYVRILTNPSDVQILSTQSRGYRNNSKSNRSHNNNNNYNNDELDDMYLDDDMLEDDDDDILE